MVVAVRTCPRLHRVKIAVAREYREGETRVAMVPELVGKLTTLGYEVLVVPGAGEGARRRPRYEIVGEFDLAARM